MNALRMKGLNCPTNGFFLCQADSPLQISTSLNGAGVGQVRGIKAGLDNHLSECPVLAVMPFVE